MFYHGTWLIYAGIMLQMVLAGALVRPFNSNRTKMSGKETQNQVMIHQLINWIHMDNPTKAHESQTELQQVESMLLKCVRG